MKIFAIDTSSDQICLAYSDGKNIYSASYVGEQRHMVKLAPMIEDFSRLAGLRFEELDALACGVGPGSLTALRIGIATVQAIACAHGKRIIPVVSSKVMAMNFLFHEGHVVVVKHAREHFVYFSCYQKSEEVLSPKVLSLQEAFELAQGLRNPIFAGDAKQLFQRYGQISPDELEMLRGELLIREAMENQQHGVVVEPHRVEPLYLQKSIAEMNLEKRLGV
ncbi:tRNA threonylcarbamoyladenosine biosynthesis protein TsaB [Thermotoga sp. Ku-13t]|uniref:tRNA (adenosine(37)-N6)-threonylcarbamoyltransferase complex dimerization subunit type 1 TsaB n=1 Tax=Thermotoga sp. Ku-13t TaxID=1755813 RepID=UPI0013ED7786|nr:tRNA (adenosine(37)-N6)-threonylcarbamoyltransferase complex dimerization subunit type 1 TsaB [Thermotoga sp. Ku-13t]KAF2958843.1 tRNA threonylcarbamoyladenosine biosynthesis protein TsaB [Thermotoga sp. Ku-13t]